MAVYYKWIKGCAPGASLTSGLWTYLKWGSGDSGTSQMPTLYVNTGKNDTTQTGDLGYLLTNKMPTPRITNPWEFDSSIDFITPGGNATNGPLGKIHAIDGWLNISTWTKTGDSFSALPIKMWGHGNMIGGDTYLGYGITNGGQFSENSNHWSLKVYHNAGTVVGNGLTAPIGLETKGSINIRTGQSSDVHNTLFVEGGTYLGVTFQEDGTPITTAVTASFPAQGHADGSINFYKKLVVSGQPVEAYYFSATSDKRAKENIQLATYNAIELIKKLPVYTYNYKNNSENVTGILAQDLFEAQPKELDLVSNINATGENNDYMSIKSDKLMFVLMKAIQEQQEQIEVLKAEIEKLKA